MSYETHVRLLLCLVLVGPIKGCASSSAQAPSARNQASEWSAVAAVPPAPLVGPAPNAPATTIAQVTQASVEPQPAASDMTPDPWPKSAEAGGTKYTLYQPQLDSWDNYVCRAHAAVSVLPAGSKDPIFGVVEISAVTIVDRPAQVVHLENIAITKATFPICSADGGDVPAKHSKCC